MRFTNKNVISCRNKCLITIIVGVLFIVLTCMFIGLSIKQDDSDNDNIKYLNDIIENTNEEAGQKTYLNVEKITSAFAVYDDKTDAYYYAFDGQYYYILYLKESKYLELSGMDLSDNPYRLEGIARNIPDDVKNIAIEDWNSDLADDEEPLTDLNFYKYFGNVYLDQTAVYSETASMYNVLAFFTGIIGLVVSIIGIVNFAKFSSNVKRFDGNEIDSIESEMADSESFFYKGIKLYLTRNYIIMLNGQFKVYKYSDVLWMYPFEQRYNGVRTNRAIKIFTKDGKTSMLCSIGVVTKAQKAIYDEVWNTIIDKNPNIVLGYTSENIQHFNDVKKEIKNNKKNGIQLNPFFYN